VDEIKRLESRLASVELENLRLRSLMERSQFECKLDQANRGADYVRNRSLAETRTRIGRTLASIDYRIPEHLLPSQLYTLGVSYLQARDDEKAVKILSHLVNLQDIDTASTTSKKRIATCRRCWKLLRRRPRARTCLTWRKLGSGKQLWQNVPESA
jgi:hypothetical protein